MDRPRKAAPIWAHQSFFWEGGAGVRFHPGGHAGPGAGPFSVNSLDMVWRAAATQGRGPPGPLDLKAPAIILGADGRGVFPRTGHIV